MAWMLALSVPTPGALVLQGGACCAPRPLLRRSAAAGSSPPTSHLTPEVAGPAAATSLLCPCSSYSGAAVCARHRTAYHHWHSAASWWRTSIAGDLMDNSRWAARPCDLADCAVPACSVTGSPLPWDVERPLASLRRPVRARGRPRPDAATVGRSAALTTVQWPPWAFSPHDPSADRGEKTCCIALLPSKPPARSVPAVTRWDPALRSRRGPAPFFRSRTATVIGVLDSCPSITDASAYSVAVAPPPCSLPRPLLHGPVDSRRRAVCLCPSPPLCLGDCALCSSRIAAVAAWIGRAGTLFTAWWRRPGADESRSAGWCRRLPLCSTPARGLRLRELSRTCL